MAVRCEVGAGTGADRAEAAAAHRTEPQAACEPVPSSGPSGPGWTNVQAGPKTHRSKLGCSQNCHGTFTGGHRSKRLAGGRADRSGGGAPDYPSYRGPDEDSV